MKSISKTGIAAIFLFSVVLTVAGESMPWSAAVIVVSSPELLFSVTDVLWSKDPDVVLSGIVQPPRLTQYSPDEASVHDSTKSRSGVSSFMYLLSIKSFKVAPSFTSTFSSSQPSSSAIATASSDS